MDIMVKTYICKYCGHEFTNISKGKFSAHVRLCDKNPNAQKLRDALSRGGTNKCKKYNVLSALPKKIYNCTCENCGKTFIVNCSENEFSRKKHWFCSRSCANTRTFDNSIKQKISETLYTTLAKKKHVSPEIWTKLKFCADCGTQLGKRNKSGYCKQCAPHHLSKETLLRIRRGALKSVQVQSITRRSKNEMAFCDLEGLTDIEEEMLKYVIKYVIDNCPAEIDFCDQFVEKGLKTKLTDLLNAKFTRISHHDVVDILLKANQKWEFTPNYNDDIAKEHETKDKLQAKVNDIFNRMYHGNRRVQIDNQ